MKLLSVAVFALLFSGLDAHDDSPRQVLITYPQDTTSQYLADARHRIETAVSHSLGPQSSKSFATNPQVQGGKILHEFGKSLSPLCMQLIQPKRSQN